MTAQGSRGWGPGTSAIVRALVAATRPVTQGELAALVGVSQPRVSQVVRRLADAAAVAPGPDGYTGRTDELIDLYVANHRPALVTPEAPWYGLRSMPDQIADLCGRARDTSARVAMSADLAPDLLAPWRHPTLTVVYTDHALDLSETGFVRAEGRVDATVLVRHTSDSTLLAPFDPWPRAASGVPLADPVQQIRDLHDLGGADRAEAADRLRDAVLRGLLGATT